MFPAKHVQSNSSFSSAIIFPKPRHLLREMSADDARCRICWCDEPEDGDAIVFCEGCEVAVHQVRAPRTLSLCASLSLPPPDSSVGPSTGLTYKYLPCDSPTYYSHSFYSRRVAMASESCPPARGTARRARRECSIRCAVRSRRATAAFCCPMVRAVIQSLDFMPLRHVCIAVDEFLLFKRTASHSRVICAMCVSHFSRLLRHDRHRRRSAVCRARRAPPQHSV
jgi:hypothetical protein